MSQAHTQAQMDAELEKLRGGPAEWRPFAPPVLVDSFAGRDALFAGAFIEEYRRARTAHGPMNSAHEGYAVILEELDEIKQIVWQKQKNRNYADLRKEGVQLGAMALAFLVEIVDTENRK